MIIHKFVQAVAAFLRQRDIDVKLERIKQGLVMAVKEERDGYERMEEGLAQAVEGLGWEENAGLDGYGEEEKDREAEYEDVEVEGEDVEEVASSGDEGKKEPMKQDGGGKGGKAPRYVAPWGKRPSKDWIVAKDKWGGCRYNSGWYWLQGDWYPFPGW